MCGIAVNYSKGKEAAPFGLAGIRHRGPDASGEWRDATGQCWMGHVRLAILELSEAGAQPMVSACGRAIIAFNGEIYNHLDLRRELRAPAAGWRGQSDTETLVEAYVQWGKGMLERLNGMFAFVIFDQETESLFGAVDRFGIKPLYFRMSPNEARFCSEVRELAGAGVEISGENLCEYLRWGCLPAGRSLWSGIGMVKPGHWIRVDRDMRLEEQRYWPTGPIAAADQQSVRAEDVRKWVEGAVERHLLADVPVAAFLSGGIDSSIVALVAGRLLGRRLSTFNIGFAGLKVDESSVADKVARKAGVGHHSLMVSEEEALAMVPKAVAAMDSPSVDAVNTFLVASQVREAGIKVALSGLGGDELFGGYPSFSDVPLLGRLARVPRWVWRTLSPFWGKAARLVDLPSRDTANLARWRRAQLSSRERVLAGLPEGEWRPEWAPELPDSFSEISWQEIFGYTSPMLLRDSDQMSMAVSLEIRVPFLDHVLVERVLALPGSAKGGRPPKRLLIEAFQGDLPEEVWKRPKQGFELPMDDWMRGPLQGFVREGLQRISECQLVGEPLVERRRADFESRRLHWTRLWALVVLGHYLHNNQPTG